MLKKYRYLIVVAAAGLLLILHAARTVFAHSRITVGEYGIVVGWVVEPPIVGERNALFVEITEGDAPVTGVEATLNAEILYGGRSFQTNLNPSPDNPGQYTAEIFPTVRGQYTVRLSGAINEQPVDETLEPEEVFAATRLQFPEPQPDARALQQELQSSIQSLESQLRTARVLAIAGLAAGILGICLAVISLRFRKTS